MSQILLEWIRNLLSSMPWKSALLVLHTKIVSISWISTWFYYLTTWTGLGWVLFLLVLPEVIPVFDGPTEAEWSKMALLTFLANDAACCLIGPEAGGFISTPCSIFSSKWWKNSKRTRVQTESLLKLSLLVAHCHFWYVQLAEANYRASLDSWKTKVVPQCDGSSKVTLQWEADTRMWEIIKAMFANYVPNVDTVCSLSLSPSATPPPLVSLPLSIIFFKTLLRCPLTNLTLYAS